MEKQECKKNSFNSEEEADTELRRIVETNYNPIPSRNKKPSRKYLCPHCDKWHLSSSPKIKEY